MRRLILAAGGLLVAAATAVGAAPAAAAQETGSVYVVHGIPDTPVDIYVDGSRALDDLQPGASAGLEVVQCPGAVDVDGAGLLCRAGSEDQASHGGTPQVG